MRISLPYTSKSLEGEEMWVNLLYIKCKIMKSQVGFKYRNSNRIKGKYPQRPCTVLGEISLRNVHKTLISIGMKNELSFAVNIVTEIFINTREVILWR